MVKSLTVYKASAGSGKTFTLASEYIKLLVRNPLSYRQILAVTFTNKATEEMKMRILSQLYGISHRLDGSKSYARKIYEALDGELTEDQIAERAGQALRLLLHNYSYFRVETIDSFFQSVMRNLARELNLTANLRVGLNDHQVEEMAVDQLIDSLTVSDQLLQWLMKYIMDNISDDRSWNVIGQIKKFGRTIFDDYYKQHSERITQLMGEKDFFDHYQTQLRNIRQQASDRMKDIANMFFNTLSDEGLGINDLTYGISGVAGLFLKLQREEFDENVLTKRATDCIGQPDKWCKKTHPHREQIIHLADSKLDALLRHAVDEQPRQWKLYKSADLTLRHLSQLRLLGSIEQKVRQLNVERNRFLLSDTQQLLHELIDGSDTPFIFEKIGTQLEHIMIDEFQDTSTVQWQNFKILLQETMSHKGSENLIVGDVKQSIYRWRSGDWRLLANIEKQFPRDNEIVSIETLDKNFRSASRIVSFNNAFFTEAVRQTNVTAYDDVEQKVPEGKADEGLVEVTLLPADDYDQQMLEAVSRQVAQLLEAGTPASEIAILVRVNKKIPLIARQLMEQLPDVKVVSDEAFRLDASPAVNTIITALRYLVHPEDNIAQAYLQKFPPLTTHLSPQSSSPSGGGWKGASQLLSLPLYELVEQLYALLHLNRLGNQSAYLCAFFDQVATFATDYGSDIDAFLREWDETIASKTIQSPEADGLRIISIHKSKGLEFPFVLIPFCDWRMEIPDVFWCEPREAPFNQLPLAPIDFSMTGMKGTIYEAAYDEEHQQNIVDNMNLLYVAFTRASQGLYVYGRRKAPSASRSALIEQVLPTIVSKLDGSTITGEEDESQPLVFTSQALPLSRPDREGNKEEVCLNPFLQEATPVKVGIGIYTAKADFRQSNKSREFAQADEADEEQARQKEYIQLGSVLHNVLSSIRTSDDVESVLWQLEQDGILYGDGELARPKLASLLRQRLASPQVAEWFRPGRWQLFNECNILSIDPVTGRVVERRPDRVMTDGEQTIVVDFKFGREREEYHTQMRQYMSLLTTMGHQNVKGYLWLIYTNKIIEVV
jgi:ATP-dependent exoDNAse (exonuclease V) beta subunit